VVIAAALFALGWWLLTGAPGPADGSPRPGEAGQGGAGRPATLAGYDLLLITLDTLRADRLGAYGYEGVETPNIDRLAAEGARFERVTTTVPVTLPAHASIMTGQYPFTHGVRNNGSFLLRDDATTLAESLRAAGYATGGFIGAVVLGAKFGIGQGFDTYPGLDSVEGTAADLDGERRAEEVVAEAGGWMRRQTGRRFTWVHLYDPHDPYDPPEPFASRHVEHPYDGEVAYTDAMVGRLLETLQASGRAGNTLIVLTSDHGESFGEHGEQGHSFFVYDSTVRVPLIFWAPPAIPAGVVVEGAASVVDIAPTVASLLGVPLAAPAGGAERSRGSATGGVAPGGGSAPDDGNDVIRSEGVDLSLRFAAPAAPGTAAYAESLIPYLDFGWSELRALVEGGYKYIEAPEPELYDLSADPGETTNLVDADPERAEAMGAALQELIRGDDVTRAGGGVVDADSLERLRSLGYLGGAGEVADRRDIDPKDMIGTYDAFVAGLLEAVDATAERRFDDANETLVRLDELVPDQYIVYYYLGQLALAAGDPPTAVRVLERALELSPSYLPTYSQLANALYAAGDLAAAQDLLAEAGAMFPDDFNLRLLSGAFYHDAGELDAALAAYRRAAAIRPDHSRLLERLAHLYLLRRQPRDAVDALRRLTRASPDNAANWAQLAFALAQIGESAEAGRALRQALAIDPDDPLVRQVMEQLR
jgi:arylsulfatase A-like enzyme/Flp pilus assembly protein TadD